LINNGEILRKSTIKNLKIGILIKKILIKKTLFSNVTTAEIVYNETGYNEQPDITSRFGAEIRSRRCTYMFKAISVITRTGYNEQIRLDLGARYIRFLMYISIIGKKYFKSKFLKNI